MSECGIDSQASESTLYPAPDMVRIDSFWIRFSEQQKPVCEEIESDKRKCTQKIIQVVSSKKFNGRNIYI